MMPLRHVWYFPPRSLSIFDGTESSSPMGCMIWTLPSNPALSFIFWTIQSMKHLRKLPSPNCSIFVSIFSFPFVDLVKIALNYLFANILPPFTHDRI